ncbi:MAG: polysaccharide deacetylase family protein [Tepidisphaeraceae bacterium]
MNPHAFMTTSWDDGHPLDYRIAEMLQEYGLRGTFYIPKQASTGTMPARDVRTLSNYFEIGAHTMHHTFLDTATDLTAEREITESKAWVEAVTGHECKMFCPPAGKFSSRDQRFMRRAGYMAMRSVELMSTGLPVEREGVWVMPTTVHAFPHGPKVYVKNAIKRRAPKNLWRYLVQGRMGDWVKLAESMLQTVASQGGVFHVWGHSWEIEETNQWSQLETVLKRMGEYAKQMPCLANGELCDAIRSAPAHLHGHEEAMA